MGVNEMAALNGRKIPKSDKVFGINNMANEMAKEKGRDAVVNATIGALTDDSGNLIVLSSVDRVFRGLEPKEYAQYAPIGGTSEFKAAAVKAAFGSFTANRSVRVVATMGGTGGIKNTVSNYSSPGESILTTDWCWGPYSQICSEIGRGLETFPLFTDDGKFNTKAFSMKVADIIDRQNRLVIILNTPAHNPTGYSMTNADWESVRVCLDEISPDKRIALLIDAAYIDFAGDEDEVRAFLPIVDAMPENVLPIVAYSMSKTFTLYGMRCGAMICMAPNDEIADEFQRCCEFSCRASWSNPVRAAQSIIAKIFADPDLYDAVVAERAGIRDMLIRRGRAFDQAAKDCGLVTVPFSAGFFCSIPHGDPDGLAAKLREEGIFLIPLAKGVRVSVASISEDVCRILPARIKAAIDALDRHAEGC